MPVFFKAYFTHKSALEFLHGPDCFLFDSSKALEFLKMKDADFDLPFLVQRLLGGTPTLDRELATLKSFKDGFLERFPEAIQFNVFIKKIYLNLSMCRKYDDVLVLDLTRQALGMLLSLNYPITYPDGSAETLGQTYTRVTSLFQLATKLLLRENSNRSEKFSIVCRVIGSVIGLITGLALGLFCEIQPLLTIALSLIIIGIGNIAAKKMVDVLVLPLRKLEVAFDGMIKNPHVFVSMTPPTDPSLLSFRP